MEQALVEARRRGEATLATVVDILLTPTEHMAAAIRTTPELLAAGCREVALELRRLCDGALAGMFRRPDHRRRRLLEPVGRRRPLGRVPLPRAPGGDDLCGGVAPGGPLRR